MGSEDEDEDQTPPREAPQAGVAYDLSITGIEDRQLLDILESASQLRALIKRPPATVAGLGRRARNDLERLRATLKSEGYYAATLSYQVDATARPVTVRLNVVPGGRYTLSAFKVEYLGEAAPASPDQPTLQDLGIRIGMPARAPALRGAERKVTAILGERGYPFAKVTNLKAVVNHPERRMTVHVTVDPEMRARFGPLAVVGLTSVDVSYIRRLVTWGEGDIFDRRKVASTRSVLSATNLFISIKISIAPKLDEQGRLPVTIELSERPHRSVGAGLSYSTDIGFNGEVYWEHRNILGRNERLRATITGAEIGQRGKLEFRKPAFLAHNQALLSEASITNRDTDAFEEQSVAATVALERQYRSNWRATLGVTGEFAKVTDNFEDHYAKLFGLPVTASRATTDDPLNPTRGFKLNLSATPYVGTYDEALSFLRMRAGGSTYHAIDKGKRFVAASRLRIGSLVGASRESLPADKRFYAGGGGSVRGYEFERVGPLDFSNDPLGGRSLIELSGELRVRVTEKFGIVPFIDGGTVFDDSYPSFNETIRWAAGLGLRYFTGFGPLRADVAFPINGRDGVDDTFEFYISIGQAF